MPMKSNIAPEIFRQRLLLEAYYEGVVTRQSLHEFLLSLANHLDLRTYSEPVIYSPDTGMGKSENAGFDAFVPLIDSGISAYIWTEAKFASILLYTCKSFDERQAIDYCRDALCLRDPIETQSF